MTRALHRQGGGVRGRSSGFVSDEKIVGSELSECKRAHTLFEYTLGKRLEANLLKQLLKPIIKRFGRTKEG